MRLVRQLAEAGAAGLSVGWGTGVLRPVAPSAVLKMAGAGVRHGPAASALLALSAARWPERECIVDDEGSTTYAEVYGRVGRLAGALRRRGVGRGSTVGVLCRNHVGFVVASFAAMWTDADLVLLNTDFGDAQLRAVTDGHHLDVIIHDVELTPIVSGSGFTGVALVADSPGAGSISELEGENHPAPRGGGRHGRLIILTSGTTGIPKGSQRDPEALGAIAPISSLIGGIGLRSGDPVLVLPPLFHGFGLAYLLVSMVLGCPVSVMRRFDPVAVLARIEQQQTQVLFAVPVMLSRLVDLPADVRAGTDTSSLRAVQSGASHLPPDLAARFMDAFGEVVHDVYGSTETGWSTLASPSDIRTAPGTVGRPLKGVSVRILDDADRPVPPGQVGVIYIDSGMTAPQYVDGRSKKVVDRHVSTGDLGHFDAAGRLFVDGREDDMIVSGGENVFPGEVEDVIDAHPGVREVMVHGVDDEEFGQRLRALVVLHDGAEVSAEDIRTLVRDRLARFTVPRDIVFVEALERTATGKSKRVR